jgi:hypothetical protein
MHVVKPEKLAFERDSSLSLCGRLYWEGRGLGKRERGERGGEGVGKGESGRRACNQPPGFRVTAAARGRASLLVEN